VRPAITILAAATQWCFGQVSVPMAQYNFNRTGANLSEFVLNTSNVNPAHFGKLFARTVDDSVYGLPLIIPNLPIADGVHDVLFVATMNNSVYAFDAVDAARTQPYWSVNLGTPGIGDSWIGPAHFGILSTPFIDVATNTIYLVAKIQNATDVGLYLHALDITTGRQKYGSPQRMSFSFPTEGITLTNVAGGIQRAGLLVSNGVLYVATANILPGDYDSQEGFVQSFDAQDLTHQLGNFQSTPGAPEGKGGIWEAGRGLPADASGVYFSIAGGAYNSTSNPRDFGSSVVKAAPGTLNVQDWFTPRNWQYLFDNNIDPAAGGVTLIPGTQFLFAGGKEGVIYLLNRNNMGHLEDTDGQPVQRFQAGYGCAQNTAAPDCAQSLGTAYWDRGGDGMLYAWDKTAVLRAYHFDGDLFETAAPQVGTLTVGMTGGPSVSANGADPSSAIVWAVTSANVDSATPGAGTLRAFRADDITQELYNSDINQASDSLGTMTKFAPPVVANGRVYVTTQSNSVQVYGLLPAGGEITIASVPAGLSLVIDNVACTTPCRFHWPSGSNHTISASDQSGNAGTQYLFNTWSDSGAASHVIAAPNTDTTYTASFTTQSSSSFLTGFALNSPPQRNDFSGWIGMQLTLGSSPLTVTALGRIFLPGNSGTHSVKLVRAVDGADVPGGSASIPMSGGTAGQFQYAFLPTPVTLSANTAYYLVSQEVNGGDKWYEHGVLSSTGVATVSSSVYSYNGSWFSVDGPNTSYGPPNFLYSIDSAPPPPPDPNPQFVTGYNLNNRSLRNDFTGWVGMKLTVSSSPVTVNALGRINVAGSTGSHMVKLVRASDGTDLPGGSASVTVGGGTGGQFQYTSLASPVTLSANTSYYLVSQEVNGGDSWYDHGTLSSTSAAAVNSSVYFYNGAWIPLDGPNTSYGPPNFLYGSPAGTIPVTIETNPSGRSFSIDGATFTSTQVLNWTPGSTHMIATTTQSGSGTQYVWNTWSDGGATSHTIAPSTATTYTANFTTQFLLSASVAGSGTIAVDPVSASGYYDSGTSVELTATATGSGTFANWSGDLSGGVNPQSVTMSAPRTVTASFEPPGGSSASFLTGFALNSPPQRNDFSGWIGMKLTVGSSPLTVTALGRLCLTGNSGTHIVKLVRANDGIDVPGAAASISMAGGTAAQVQYVILPSPIILSANTAYYLVSQEASGGDKWYEHGALSSTNVATVNSSVYFYNGSWFPADGPGTSYGPPNFLYSVDPASPPPDSNQQFVTSYNLNNKPLRNDFSGWVGMKLTVGTGGLTVNAVGRIVVSGNTGTHLVKLVRASDGTDVPGGSASVVTAGGTAGQFQYAFLATPLTLPANSAYYLVSEEKSGGDAWYDHGTLSSTSAAAVSSSVYFYSGAWISLDGPNTSYGPVGFLY
jgi:List-Bact-rpt repeat protein